MISVVLAAGNLPPELAQHIFTNSPLRVPLGSRVSIETVISQELGHSDFCYVVVESLDDVPIWLRNKSPRAIWVEQTGAEKKSIGQSLLTALKSSAAKRIDNKLRVLFADTLSDIVGFDLVAVAKPAVIEDWTFAPESLSHDIVDPRSRVIDPRVITGAFTFGQLDLLERELAESVNSPGHDENHEPMWWALRQYAASEGVSMTYFDDNEWVDFGHVESFFRHRRKSLTGRATNNFRDNGIFIEKGSTNSEKLLREAAWFGNVPADLFEYLPRVALSASDGYNIQFLEGLTLAEILLFSTSDHAPWSWILDSLDGWLSASAKFESTEGGSDFSAEWFTAHFSSRISELSEWLAPKTDFIESQSMLGSDFMQGQVFALGNLLGDSKSVVVHGDLILSNIIAIGQKKSVKLIDPRGGFLRSCVYGPQLYDWAKLAQGIYGRYEEIVTGQFKIDQSGSEIKIQFWSDSARNDNYQQLQDWFMSRCPDPKSAIQIAGLLLLAATPFHFEDSDRVLAMTSRGLDLIGAK